ncbi:MAG: hypothetical protein HY438_00385 [DPANN group archaeon]|nr:hypothetical protein [DPANN group archaeon]
MKLEQEELAIIESLKQARDLYDAKLMTRVLALDTSAKTILKTAKNELDECIRDIAIVLTKISLMHRRQLGMGLQHRSSPDEQAKIGKLNTNLTENPLYGRLNSLKVILTDTKMKTEEINAALNKALKVA